jgi:heme-degrading monooxygenase HmoA
MNENRNSDFLRIHQNYANVSRNKEDYMPIQVIIKRKWEVDKPEALLPLLTELRSLAKKQPGYISGETLRSLDDPEDYIVISKWKSADDWQKWLQSKERRDLQGRVDSLIGEKTFYEIFEPVSH